MVAPRFENWPLLLSNYISEKRKEPFAWGSNDCLLFIAKAFERLTGTNIYEEYLGYTTEEGAKEILNANNGVQGILTKHFGGGHRDILSAKRGDIALLKLPEFTAGLIDDSGRYALVVSPQGLLRKKIENVWRIWSY